MNLFIASDSNEYVFVYDISNPAPALKQVVQLPSAYNGIVFDPSGAAFYVGGCAADVVWIVDFNATRGLGLRGLHVNFPWATTS